MQSTLPQTIELNPAEPASATVFILHGLGADGTDFLPFADELDLASVGPVRFVFPRAPVRPVTVNGGHRMRAWYDIIALGGAGSAAEDEAGLREAFAQVHGLLEREVARGVPASRIVLAGFSQGGAIAIYTALRHRERLAGIVALSTYLVDAGSLTAEASPANRDLPIVMAHGTRDPVIPIALAEASRDTLVSAGWRVEWHAYTMEHSAVLDEIRVVGAFLARVLARPG